MPWTEEEAKALEEQFAGDRSRVTEMIRSHPVPDGDGDEGGGNEDDEPRVVEAPEGDDGTETPDPPTGDEGDESLDGDAGGEGDEEPPPPPAQEDFVEFDGRRLSRQEAKALVEFYEWANQNPQAMAGVNGYLSGQYDLVPRGQQPQQTPEQRAAEEERQRLSQEAWDDLDPIVRERLAEVDQIRQELAYFRQQHQDAALADARAQLQVGVDRFNDRFKLSEEELKSLQDETGALGILPSLIHKHNGDKIAAVEEALETTYWRSEEFRMREFQRQQQQERKTKDRTTKASKLAGSSGSVPRETQSSSPATREEKKEAMIAEIASAMGKN